MLDDRLERALQLAGAGYRSDMENPQLSRLYSEVLLAMHLSLDIDINYLDDTSTAPSESSGTVTSQTAPPRDDRGATAESLPDLRYLDLACQIDSSNPALVPEIAKMIAAGQQLSTRMKGVLERSLADGTASGITHLILANKKLTGETPEAAIPQLRLAMRQMPNSPVVMNNLAYALMKYAPQELDEAQQLMERALSIPGGSVQERASMLAAIELFEQAIELDSSKLGTRRHLIKAYQQAGMPELATAQQQRIEELSSRKD